MSYVTTDPLGLHAPGAVTGDPARRQRRPRGENLLNKYATQENNDFGAPRQPDYGFGSSPYGGGNPTGATTQGFGGGLFPPQPTTTGGFRSRSDETLYQPSFLDNNSRGRTGISPMTNFGSQEGGGGIIGGLAGAPAPARQGRRRINANTSSLDLPSEKETQAALQQKLQQQQEMDRRRQEEEAARKREADRKEEERVKAELEKMNREYQAEMKAREEKEQKRKEKMEKNKARREQIEQKLAQADQEPKSNSRSKTSSTKPPATAAASSTIGDEQFEGDSEEQQREATPEWLKSGAPRGEPIPPPIQEPQVADLTSQISGLSAFGDFNEAFADFKTQQPIPEEAQGAPASAHSADSGIELQLASDFGRFGEPEDLLFPQSEQLRATEYKRAEPIDLLDGADRKDFEPFTYLLDERV
ncbi:unnamed protein product [Cyprideis torosa]|uniref:Uncharacterized protein n=1 Tax=Cyprideis torosa TaxID=163714 RepID=A0A7R8ZNC6_9CRUS|nr:unnamed protein product [Cyprideis torosa]CAG0891265.1 unnamed protein product [Cyprideis torosa]